MSNPKINPPYKQRLLKNKESLTILKYINENLFKTLFIVSTIFGGILLFSYFLNNKFLPDIDLNSSLAIIYAISAFGITFIIFLIIPKFTFLLPIITLQNSSTKNKSIIIILALLAFACQIYFLFKTKEWLNSHVLCIYAIINIITLLLPLFNFPKNTLILIFAMEPILFILTIFITGSLYEISSLGVNKLGLGNIGATQVVLSGDGYKQFKLASNCTHCPKFKNNDPVAICPIILRSRIGNQVILEVKRQKIDNTDTCNEQCSGKQENCCLQRVVLEKSAVIAWTQVNSIPNDINNSNFCHKDAVNPNPPPNPTHTKTLLLAPITHKIPDKLQKYPKEHQRKKYKPYNCNDRDRKSVV